MHIPAHILSGWCISSTLKSTPRERFLYMVVAVIPDIDGIGIFLSHRHYRQYHHIVAHSLLFGILISVIFAFLFKQGRFLKFFLCLLFFHLHLLLDIFGSGKYWGMAYFWPLSDTFFISDLAWNSIGWQNFFIFFLVLCLTFFILHKKSITPFELVLPKLNQFLVKRYAKFPTY